MTGDKIIMVAMRYLHELNQLQYTPKRSTEDRLDYLNHAAWMCQELIEKIGEFNIEKSMRWLGFIQGVLWVCGIHTIDEMRRHNMPDTDVFTARAIK